MKGGTGMILLLAGAFWLWSRRGSAASSSSVVVTELEREEAMRPTTGWRGTRADVEAGIHQAEADHELDQSRAAAILERWGALFGRFPEPLPPQLAAVVISRESGGNPSATAGDAVLGEKGLWQLSRDECTAAGVADPMDPTSSTSGAQKLYRAAIRAFPEPDAESQLLIALLSRSIGLGDTRRLRALVPAAAGMTFAQRLRRYVEDEAQGMPAAMAGRIDAKMWARRVYRGILRAETTVVLGWVSPTADFRTLA